MFRFTIRDVLWLTVVVALGVWCALSGWRIASLQRQRDNYKNVLGQLVDQLRAEGVLIERRGAELTIGGYSGPGFGRGPSAFNPANQTGQRPN